jgi:hypothetical protein
VGLPAQMTGVESHPRSPSRHQGAVTTRPHRPSVRRWWTSRPCVPPSSPATRHCPGLSGSRMRTTIARRRRTCCAHTWNALNNCMEGTRGNTGRRLQPAVKQTEGGKAKLSVGWVGGAHSREVEATREEPVMQAREGEAGVGDRGCAHPDHGPHPRGLQEQQYRETREASLKQNPNNNTNNNRKSNTARHTHRVCLTGGRLDRDSQRAERDTGAGEVCLQTQGD